MGNVLARALRMAPVAVLVVMAGWGVVHANDRAIKGAGGRVVSIKGEHGSVRMVRETVDIDVWPKAYEVHARFWFQNDGPATRVKMGFPETGGGDVNVKPYRTRTAFFHFESAVDGRPVQVSRVLTRGGAEEYYEAYWVKDVSFAAHQGHIVDVRYRSPLGGMADTCDADPRNAVGAQYASYDFTGGNWKGLVDSSRLVVRMHVPGYLISGRSTKAQRKGDELTWTRTHWQAEEHFNLVFCPTGKGYLCPASDRRLLTEKDLQGRRSRDLSLMRNEIYARYGRPFRDPQVRAWFDLQSWYRPVPSYTDTWLEDTEQKNAAFIQRYQDQHHLTW